MSSGELSSKKRAPRGDAEIQWRRTSAYVAALLGLALTAWLYLQPELAVDMASQLWSCF
jgi:hypothetical protein